MYASVLAEIHDRWFGAIAVAAAHHISNMVGTTRRVSMLDLGCGSGTLLSTLQSQCSRQYGVDVSSDMIHRAKAKVPGCDFRVGDILSVDFPTVDVVTMVGEILSYATATEMDAPAIVGSFFKRVFACLAPEGIFLFDVLGDQHRYAGTSFHDNDSWSVFSEVSVAHSLVKRHIVSFIARDGRFDKSVEDHQQRMFENGALAALLTDAGFSVKRIGSYATTPMLPGRIAFECRKVGA